MEFRFLTFWQKRSSAVMPCYLSTIPLPMRLSMVECLIFFQMSIEQEVPLPKGSFPQGVAVAALPKESFPVVGLHCQMTGPADETLQPVSVQFSPAL